MALSAAVAGGALMGLSAPVQAVNLAQDNLGEAFVFPYYTVRDNWTTLFNVTNTSDKTVLAKVRWREGVNSRDVRDFNVILSPFDVWTALTRTTTDGLNAEMITADTSCTFPQLEPRGTNSDGKALTGIAFTNAAYINLNSEDNRDSGAETLDRTREGYFELISMGQITDGAAGIAGVIARGAKHGPTGASNNTATPSNCGAVQSVLRSNSFLDINNALDAPENVLKARAVLVNGQDGIAAGYDPVVLANFASSSIYADASDKLPSMRSADPQAIIIDDNTATLTTFTPASFEGQDAVSELISRNSVINDYNVKGDSETDWVLTFPTKNFYVDRARSTTASFAEIPFGQPAPLAPFDGAVDGEVFGGVQLGKSCFDITVNTWDREEFDTPPEDEQDFFSPREPGQVAGSNQLCYEANIVSFGDSDLFGSGLRKSIGSNDDLLLPGLNGWAEIAFGDDGAASLPVVGMRVEVRRRANDAGKNFGFANDHAYTRSVAPTITAGN